MKLTATYKLAAITMATSWVSSSAYKKEDKIRLRGAAFEKLVDYFLPQDEIPAKEVELDEGSESGGLIIEIEHIDNDATYTDECNGVVENAFNTAFVEINHGEEDKLDITLDGIQFNYDTPSANVRDVAPQGLGQVYPHFWWYYGYYFLGYTCRWCNPANDDDPNYPYLTVEDETNHLLADHHAEFQSKVMELLLASDCAAFGSITAVNISYGTSTLSMLEEMKKPRNYEDVAKKDETKSKAVELDEGSESGGLIIKIEHIDNDATYTDGCNGVVENAFNTAFIEINHGEEDKLDITLDGIQFNYDTTSANVRDVAPQGLGQVYPHFWWYYGYYFLGYTCRWCNPANDDDPNYPYLTVEDETNHLLADHHAEFQSKVMELLLASDCAAFGSITAVNISYGTHTTNILEVE